MADVLTALDKTIKNCETSIVYRQSMQSFTKTHTAFLLDLASPASSMEDLKTNQSVGRVQVFAIKSALFQDVLEQSWWLLRKFQFLHLWNRLLTSSWLISHMLLPVWLDPFNRLSLLRTTIISNRTEQFCQNLVLSYHKCKIDKKLTWLSGWEQ